MLVRLMGLIIDRSLANYCSDDDGGATTVLGLKTFESRNFQFAFV